ncbi:hypothetical protein [Polymorphospora rubra]|uniref:hypothetical protein n=1 Tax=Polymorphospora rubra TaxID=338584 RepID=UPI0033DB16AC
MGLGISIGNPCLGLDPEGAEHYREQFARLRRELAEHGHDWSAPDGPAPAGTARPYVGSFPYGYLHRLRRVYALQHERQPVTPVTGPDDLEDAQEHVEEATFMLGSHLLCHSDATGFYVPVPSGDPLFLSDAIDGAGMVGSSQGLLGELAGIAPLVGIRLEADGTLSDAEAARLFDDRDDPFEIEQMVWLTLHESCRVSVASGHAIVFT